MAERIIVFVVFGLIILLAYSVIGLVKRNKGTKKEEKKKNRYQEIYAPNAEETLSDGRKQRIKDIFHDANINLTNIIRSKWINSGYKEFPVTYEPRVLAKLLGMKIPKTEFVKLKTQIYEITLELEGTYKLYATFNDLTPIKITNKEQRGLFFNVLIPVEEDISYEQKMEIIWLEILKRVKKDVREIESAKKRLKYQNNLGGVKWNV